MCHTKPPENRTKVLFYSLSFSSHSQIIFFFFSFLDFQRDSRVFRLYSTYFGRINEPNITVILCESTIQNKGKIQNRKDQEKEETSKNLCKKQWFILNNCFCHPMLRAVGSELAADLYNLKLDKLLSLRHFFLLSRFSLSLSLSFFSFKPENTPVHPSLFSPIKINCLHNNSIGFSIKFSNNLSKLVSDKRLPIETQSFEKIEDKRNVILVELDWNWRIRERKKNL